MEFQYPHQPPEGYTYEATPFQRNVIAIWIRNHRWFSFNNGGTVRSIWGFYNTKTKQYHAPVNSRTVGDVVDVNDTTPYSAMQINV